MDTFLLYIPNTEIPVTTPEPDAPTLNGRSSGPPIQSPSTLQKSNTPMHVVSDVNDVFVPLPFNQG